MCLCWEASATNGKFLSDHMWSTTRNGGVWTWMPTFPIYITVIKDYQTVLELGKWIYMDVGLSLTNETIQLSDCEMLSGNVSWVVLLCLTPQMLSNSRKNTVGPWCLLWIGSLKERRLNKPRDGCRAMDSHVIMVIRSREVIFRSSI